MNRENITRKHLLFHLSSVDLCLYHSPSIMQLNPCPSCCVLKTFFAQKAHLMEEPPSLNDLHESKNSTERTLLQTIHYNAMPQMKSDFFFLSQNQTSCSMYFMTKSIKKLHPKNSNNPTAIEMLTFLIISARDCRMRSPLSCSDVFDR